MSENLSSIIEWGSEGYSDEEFLIFLSDNISKKKRKEIIESAHELALEKGLSPKDLLFPLENHEFSIRENTSYELLCVLENSIVGLKIEENLDVYQRLYIASMFLWLFRKYGFAIEISDSAMSIVLDKLLDTDKNLDCATWFKKFLFHQLKSESDWSRVGSYSYFSLLGILFLLSKEEKQNSSDFRIILEFLVTYRKANPAVLLESCTHTLVEDWRNLANKSVPNGAGYRKKILSLIPKILIVSLKLAWPPSSVVNEKCFLDCIRAADARKFIAEY